MKKALLFVLLVASPAFGQGAQRIAQATQNVSGYLKVISGAAISVCTYPACNAVTVYQDPGLLIPYKQPLAADPNGNYHYFASPGSYFEKVSSSNVTTTTTVITLSPTPDQIAVDFASPPPIGNVTPNTGAFTTVSANSGFSGQLTGNVLGNVTGNINGTVGEITPNTGSFTTLTASSTTTFPAPLLTNLTGATQCLHVDATGQISGTGVDCGSGSGGGNVTGSGLTLNSAVFGSGGTAIKVDNSIFDTSGTLTALGFSGPLNGTVGSIVPFSGSFTTVSASSTITGNLTGSVLGNVTGNINGMVGNLTPNTGSFTTLTSTGGALNGTLGATTPSTVVATTVGSSHTPRGATGVFNLSNTDGIAWRNFANSADNTLGTNTSNQLTYGGGIVSTAASTLTANAAVFGTGLTTNDIKVDTAITTNGVGTLNAIGFNGTLGANTPATGTFTTVQTNGEAITKALTAPTDEKVWDEYTDPGAGTLVGRAVNDAFNAANPWLEVTRTGDVPTGVTLFEPLAATVFNGPLNGTVGAITPAAGVFTNITASGNVVASGAVESNADFINFSPVAPTDEKRWDSFVDPTAGTLVGRACNDAFSVCPAWMEVTRAGDAATNAYFFEPVVAKAYNTVLQADQYCTTPGTLDGTCLTNALAACPSTGCSIQMPEGTIVATTAQLPITVTKEVQFIGRSWDDTIVTTFDTTKDIFYIPSIGDVIFKDFQITRLAAPGSGAGIEIGIGQHILIDHMWINSQYNNVNISGDAFWDIIRSSQFTGAINDGIASACEGLLMTDNLILYNAANGLEVYGSGSVGLSKGNAYYANKGYGIWIHDSTPRQSFFVGDGVDSSGNAGVLVQGTLGFTFNNGFVYSSGANFSGSIPLDTVFINVPGLSIDNTDAQTNVISGNVFSNNGGNGVQCAGCPVAVISNNVANFNNQANAGGAGIAIINSGVAWGSVTVNGNDSVDIGNGTGGHRQAYGLTLSGGGTIAGSGNIWQGALGSFNIGTVTATQSWSGNNPTNLDNFTLLPGAPSNPCRAGQVGSRTDATGGFYVCVNGSWSQVTIP